jgi:hypothetical protein
LGSFRSMDAKWDARKVSTKLVLVDNRMLRFFYGDRFFILGSKLTSGALGKGWKGSLILIGD